MRSELFKTLADYVIPRNYHIALSLIVACIDYSPKVTTMKLTIADDIETIAEFFRSIQGLYSLSW